MKNKVLVTHLFPHLDDVAGFWLLKRFDPALKNAKMRFVPTSAGGVKLPKGQIGVGVGRGAYDEHKGDKKDSAASLVWKDLKRRRLLPAGMPGRALASLVDYVRLNDMGAFIGKPEHFRNYTKLLQAVADFRGHDSRTASEWGFTLLDALWVAYQQRETTLAAVAKGTRFMTKWGRSIGLTTGSTPSMVSAVVAEKGYALVVLRHPSGAYLHIRATPSSNADLTRLAKEVRAHEPDKEWYFHHSKKMLIHGDLVAPTKKRTSFTVKRLIGLIKALYA